jgi:hypothetical protein
MGTRCLTRVFDGDREICTLYRHYDGYPEGHGRELADFVSTKRLVNGYSSRSTLRRVAMANGAGRMAAMIVVHFAEDDIDIMPPGTSDCWEEYEYHVKCPAIVGLENNPPDGLPIAVEAYECRGGFGDKPRTKTRVEIPDTKAKAADGSGEPESVE